MRAYDLLPPPAAAPARGLLSHLEPGAEPAHEPVPLDLADPQTRTLSIEALALALALASGAACVRTASPAPGAQWS
jgi:hypothetical protein